MVKRNGWQQYRGIKTSKMSERTKTERSGALAERFSNMCNVEKCVFQDEKDPYTRNSY